MDLIFGIVITFVALLLSVYRGVYVAYPLAMACLIFIYISWKRGFSMESIFEMLAAGGRKTFIVLQIFLLIGAITSIWMASGTVPGIVYYGIKFMNPNYFILYAFLISSLVTFLIGSPFGSIGTVGVALIAIARGGNVDLNVAGGAIIAGAFVGNRVSPMASTLNLITNLTQTDIFKNIKNMFINSIPAFILSIIFYTYFSHKHPLDILGASIDGDILNSFEIGWIVLLPAVIIIVFSLFKVEVKISMLVSIIVSSSIAIFLQEYSLGEVFEILLLGFKLDEANPLYNIIKGGGIVSMAKSGVVVYLSCALSGIFGGTNMLENIESVFSGAKDHKQLFPYTIVVGVLTAAFGCSQTMSVVLSEQLMSNTYKEKGISKYQLALDLADTSVVVAAMIPWSISAFVPTTNMNISMAGYMPYAFYLYILPITSLIGLKLNLRRKLDGEMG